MKCTNKGCNYETGGFRHICDTCFVIGAPGSPLAQATPFESAKFGTLIPATNGALKAPEHREEELSGGDVNYYLLDITDPKRLAPCKVEAEDIIEALGMTFAEGNVFKALWRSCAKRVRGHGKRGTDDDGVYDGDKIAYYGARIKVQRRRKAKK